MLQPSHREPQAIPAGFRWVDLANPKMEGVKLEQHYRDTLRKLGEQGGMLGLQRPPPVIERI